jgi:S-DNA-T family DNA segregation ATPase FtsK/SpoIIIE
VLIVGFYAWWNSIRKLPLRIQALRTLGLGVMVPALAATLDVFTPTPRGATTFGYGGSIGAWLRFAFDDLGPPLARSLCIAAIFFLALSLIAPRLSRRLVLACVGALRGFYYGLRRIEIPQATVLEKPVALKIADTADEPVLLKLHRPEPAATPGPVITVHTPPQPIRGLNDPMTDTVPEVPRSFELPPLTLLNDPDAHPVADQETALRERATLLEKTFADFGITVKVVGIHTGPVITQYEIALETGLRLNKVTVLADDVALNLKVPSVRIVAPLPGRNTVGIEVPNEHRQTVRLKELIHSNAAKIAKFKLPVFIGKDVEGRPLAYDLAAMPHLLIAGRTGTGKSVCLNTIILSLLYSRTPDECRMIMIDPKMVELSEYGRIPHLMHPVVTKPEKAEAILAWAVDKMEERYGYLSKARVRNVASYNELGFEEIIRRIDPANEEERQKVPRRFPYIVIIIDEVGDLIMSMKKEVESHIIRLAQKSRAAGIHVILATQKPTVDVITGLIKSNMPARICFQVASRADSMVVLDEKGADKLLGMGDMLYMQPASSTIVRAQGAYVDDKEIERTVAHLECDEPNYESELLNLKAKSTASGDSGGASSGSYSEQLRARDELYEQAIDVVVREQRGSTSLLQRALGIGYGRASRLIDFMAEDGIVGAFNGSSARDVLLDVDEWSSRKMAV